MLGVAVLTAIGSTVAPVVVPFVLAFSPAVVAIALAWREKHGSLGRLARSTVKRPQDARWFLVLLGPFVEVMAVVGLAVAMGEPTAGLFDGLLPAALVVPLVVIIPAFTEEVGWRGYALPRLMTVMSPLAASLVLGVAWAAIHLVLYLPGGLDAGAPVLPGQIALVAYSVILTWVYVGTGGSVLVTGLLHATLNGVVPLVWNVDADTASILRACLAAVVAVALIAAGSLRRSQRTHAGNHLPSVEMGDTVT
jgi:membrane protease YdiL (CAAX protease family)